MTLKTCAIIAALLVAGETQPTAGSQVICDPTCPCGHDGLTGEQIYCCEDPSNGNQINCCTEEPEGIPVHCCEDSAHPLCCVNDFTATPSDTLELEPCCDPKTGQTDDVCCDFSSGEVNPCCNPDDGSVFPCCDPATGVPTPNCCSEVCQQAQLQALADISSSLGELPTLFLQEDDDGEDDKDKKKLLAETNERLPEPFRNKKKKCPDDPWQLIYEWDGKGSDTVKYRVQNIGSCPLVLMVSKERNHKEKSPSGKVKKTFTQGYNASYKVQLKQNQPVIWVHCQKSPGKTCKWKMVEM